MCGYWRKTPEPSVGIGIGQFRGDGYDGLIQPLFVSVNKGNTLARKIVGQLSLRPKDMGRRSMKKWQCVVCGLIYDEAEGWPEDGIEPGTKWEDVPEDWVCPDCGVGKEDFEMIEIG
jgi:rubredoxin